MKIDKDILKEIKRLADEVIVDPEAMHGEVCKTISTFNGNGKAYHEIYPLRFLKERPLCDAVGNNAPLRLTFENKGEDYYKVGHYPKILNTNAPVVLIGKGITYDTGGLDLKHQMYGMHLDKSGALAVLGTMLQLARQKKKPNVDGLLMFASNLIGSRSTVPGTVVTTNRKKKVEINDTDAEGRLVLADGIEYALEHNKQVKNIITIATLTGVAEYTLGKYAAPFFSDNPKVHEYVYKHSDKLKLYPLPAPDATKEYKSKRVPGAIVNLAKGLKAGTIAGYQFLKHFTKGTKVHLHHIDMANMDSDANGRSLGFGSQQLLDLLEVVC
jgi:leucyl aminopeptidase